MFTANLIFIWFIIIIVIFTIYGFCKMVYEEGLGNTLWIFIWPILIVGAVAAVLTGFAYLVSQSFKKGVEVFKRFKK